MMENNTQKRCPTSLEIIRALSSPCTGEAQRIQGWGYELSFKKKEIASITITDETLEKVIETALYRSDHTFYVMRGSEDHFFVADSDHFANEIGRHINNYGKELLANSFKLLNGEKGITKKERDKALEEIGKNFLNDILKTINKITN